LRPRGTRGEVARALLDAAAAQPGTVRDLAARAQVGVRSARYTASRLVSCGALAPVADGRPAVLARADQMAPALAHCDLTACMAAWRPGGAPVEAGNELPR